MDTDLIPNRLQLLRIQAKLTQADVARKLGFSSTDRISRWEQGLTFPHILNLFKLAALYRVSPHELYGELFQNIAAKVNHPVARVSDHNDVE